MMENTAALKTSMDQKSADGSLEVSMDEDADNGFIEDTPVADMEREDEGEDGEVAGSDGDEQADENDEDPGEDHEFEIIDQVESEEDEEETEREVGEDGKGDDEGSQSNATTAGRAGKSGGVRRNDYSDSSSDDDNLNDTELHALLEKGIDRDSIKKEQEPSEGKPVIKLKTVLKEFETDPFDIIPEGWVWVTHNCGMPIYLHQESRVCTMARPYSLGRASARTHDIPISAIPCLLYKKQLDKFTEREKEMKSSEPLPVTEVGPNGDTTTSEKLIAQASQNLSSPSLSEMPAVCPVNSSSSTFSAAALSSPASQESGHQRPVLVTEESSCQGRVMEETAPKEVLHTGKDEFSLIGRSPATLRNLPVETCDAGGKVVVETASDPNRCSGARDSNIAVQSSGSAEKNLAVTHCHPVPWREDSDTIMSEDGSHPRQDKFVHSHLSKDGEESAEEGEIIEDDDAVQIDTDPSSGQSRCEDSSTAISTQLPQQETVVTTTSTDLPTKLGEFAAGAFPVPDTTSKGAGVLGDGKAVSLDEKGVSGGAGRCGSQLGVTGESSANGGHIVQEEEAQGRHEPSELVTSSSNSLASIKRKIESLRNKRGVKLRRLDNTIISAAGVSASAAGWPAENNVAVSLLPFGDTRSAAIKENTTETLKANAAVVKIKSAEERAKESLLDSKTVQSYCSKLFHFKVIEVKKYSSWRERRKHLENKNRRNRPELPSSTKLITCPIPGSNKVEAGAGGSKKKEFVLNPTGKSYLCILHEYMQRTLKIQPLYVFKELENSKTPYGATVTINNIEYGTGYASSKKVAKQEAAKETLKILIPDLFNKMSDQEIKRNVSDLSFFDNVKVSDARVNELGNKVGQPSPFQILQECLRRNFGMGNTQCDVSTQPLKNQKCEFSIKVGKHSATVVAKNKRDGKQLAAQAILAKLHPHVPSWGSLLRLYGTSVEKPIQKPEEMNDAKSHAPNLSVLASLREEMRKLHKQKEAIQVKGKIIISSKDLPNKTVGVDF